MEKWIFLVLGGGIGTVCRFVTTGLVVHRAGNAFPWGTMVVNLAGCLIIGFLDVIFERKFLVIHHYRIFLISGFCGAFTTFATVILETSDLLHDGKYVWALANIFATVILGIIVFRLGSALAEMI